MSSNAKKPPVAPPVYRPQATPRVLQKKDRPGSHVVQPKVYRPEHKQPAAPPVYRVQPKPVAQPKVIQRKTAQPKIARPGVAGHKPNSSVVQRAEWGYGIAIGAAALGMVGLGIYSWMSGGQPQQAGGPAGPPPTTAGSVVPSGSSGGASSPRRRKPAKGGGSKHQSSPPSPPSRASSSSGSSPSAPRLLPPSSPSPLPPPSSPSLLHSGSGASVSGPHCASSSSPGPGSSSSSSSSSMPPRLPSPPSSDDDGGAARPARRSPGPKKEKWKVKGDGGAGARRLKVAKDEAMARGREDEDDDDGGPSGERGGYRRPKAFAGKSGKEYDKGQKGGVTCTLHGRPIEQGTNSSIHQHAERRAIAAAFPGASPAYNLALTLNAWPCWDNDYGCHMWLQGCAMKEQITITVTITGDQGGYASQHGREDDPTGTIIYRPNGDVDYLP